MGTIQTRKEVNTLDDPKRIRLELDPDTYELHRYFAMLRGLSTANHLRKLLAVYAVTAERETPPLRAHMLAWRTAQNAEHGMHGTIESDLSIPEVQIAAAQGEIPF